MLLLPFPLVCSLYRPGAGKTTTMGVLTTELAPTSGDVLLAGISVIQNPDHLRKHVGYCPQFDAIYENLTGREHVHLYASIKGGIPPESIPLAVDTKLSEVGLCDNDKDRLASHYSGGMKRKLSIACATIGYPSIVCLDEPTTGVDPVARREIWQIIKKLISRRNPKTNQKVCAILTTHSMDECEALCSRLGIMTNGALRCLGSAQHLKSKFGRGYQLELRIKTIEEDDDDFIYIYRKIVNYRSVRDTGDVEAAPSPPEGLSFDLEQTFELLEMITGDHFLSNMVNIDNLNAAYVFREACSLHGISARTLASFATLELRLRYLDAFVGSTFPGAVLRERLDTKVRYEVSSANTICADLFTTLEDNKSKLKLSESHVSQTTLEVVFNSLAAAESASADEKADDWGY